MKIMCNDMQLVNLINDQDWEFAEADTQYLTHNIHRYSGKFIPQIARKVIEILTQEGDIVLDPYNGSGTTMLEALLTGRNAIGCDINPLALLISEVKCMLTTPGELDWLVNFFEEKLSFLNIKDDLFSSQDKVEFEEIVQSDIIFGNEWFKKWFELENLKELIFINTIIKNIQKEDLKKTALLAFSQILRRTSRAHSGYPNVMFDKNAAPKIRPSKIFIPELIKITNMLKSLNKQVDKSTNILIKYGDARNIQLDNNSVDAVITHPPYIGSVPYAEYGLLSLMWLGEDPKALDKTLTGGQRQSKYVVDRFREGYSQMIHESFRVLKPNKYAFFMVGNPVVKGELIDLEKMTLDYAIEAGFTHITTVTRKGQNRRANKMGEEFLLFFKKTRA